MTSDCGTTSHREISLASQLGIDVVVTDHHQSDKEMPPALAVMNPHRSEARYPFRGLCSGGLAYKVAQAYDRKYGSGWYLWSRYSIWWRLRQLRMWFPPR